MAVFWVIIFPIIFGFASQCMAIALGVAFDAASPAQAAREEERRILRQQNQLRTQPFDYEREVEALLAGGWLTAMRGRTALRDRPSP